MRRFWPVALLLLALLLLGGLGVAGWREAQRDPIVRHASIGLRDWPSGAPPVTLLLISDLHLSRPDMSPERLARIVDRLGRLRPDAVMIAGDLTSDKLLSREVEPREAVAPLKRLRAPLGVYGVFGNHDHERGLRKVRWAYAAAGVVPLQDRVARVGPLTVGGIDDSVTEHSDFEGTVAQMMAMPGPRLLLSHAPNHFAFLPPGIRLMLAGHTHCGQVRWLQPHRPCGLVRRDGHLLIVTAGLGTSFLPVRLGAPPDVWLIRLGPVRRAR